MERAALGQSAELGTLYDSRTDSFLELSLLSKPPPSSSIALSDSRTSEIQFSFRDTYEEKLRYMGLNAELSASFLCGMINVSGSGRYLTDTRDSNQIIQASLHYKITTVDEKLNFMSDDLKQCLALNVLQNGDATHVVAGVSWGAQSVVTAKYRLSDSDDRDKVEDCLKAEFLKIKSIIKVGGKGNVEVENEHQGKTISFEVVVYGDVLADDGLPPTDFQSACKFIGSVPKYIRSANSGKGKPLVYKMVPVSTLAWLLNVEIKTNLPLIQLNIDCLQQFVHLFDSVCEVRQKLNDYYLKVSNHKFCIPNAHVLRVFQYIRDMKSAEARLKDNYARVLKDVRSGKSDAQQLFQLLKESREQTLSSENIDSLTDEYREKIEFADMIIAKGAKYIGHKGPSLNNELMSGHIDDVYVFYFNEKVDRDHTSWEGNRQLLLQLLDHNDGQYKVLVVDCEFNSINLDKSYISLYRNRRVIVQDLFEQERPDKCLAKYDVRLLEDTKTCRRPLARRLVVIPCPGRHCSSGPKYEWTCFKCFTPLEYGYSDQYLYCGCGRSSYSNYFFKCKETHHGSVFMQYKPEVLLKLLNALESFNQLNVLILGETGVGKSTFINAFINYITFETLDDAMKSEKLHWVIPCSFATQETVYDKSHPRGRYVQRTIGVGHDENEHDSTKGGQSATQKTTVYPVSSGRTMVRLIDTPGIGDTRGVKQDKENMAGILSTLKYFDQLHGILILLKSNDARLGVMLEFCVKELLTHLHRDAAQNMVFGFTNARISNYRPGDTFVPLNALLQEYHDIGIGLWPYTAYFFDSESFRFLAAEKQGVEIENKEDFSRSWQHSREEAKRLLDHFSGLPAHNVRSTVSLNKARESIAALTVPMAEIERTMKTTIQINLDNVAELNRTKGVGKKLRENLYFKRIGVETRPLSMPRTVCTDRSCVEYRDTADGTQKITVYKTHCHAQCYLDDVPPDVLCPPQLIHCDAFGGSEHCRYCGHHRGLHQHILNDQYDKEFIVKNATTEGLLRDNTDEITLKETVIRNIKADIEKAKRELEAIQDAAARFGLFLKEKSILPYNDAMIAYLDHFIRQEADKVALNKGVSRKRLEELEASRHQYLKRIEVLKRHMGAGDGGRLVTEDDVERLINQLYSLELWGNNLERLKTEIEAASRATYRERPYHIPEQIGGRKERKETKTGKQASHRRWSWLFF